MAGKNPPKDTAISDDAWLDGEASQTPKKKNQRNVTLHQEIVLPQNLDEFFLPEDISSGDALEAATPAKDSAPTSPMTGELELFSAEEIDDILIKANADSSASMDAHTVPVATSTPAAAVATPIRENEIGHRAPSAGNRPVTRVKPISVELPVEEELDDLLESFVSEEEQQASQPLVESKLIQREAPKIAMTPEEERERREIKLKAAPNKPPQKQQHMIIGLIAGILVLVSVLVFLLWPEPSTDALIDAGRYKEALPRLVKEKRWGKAGALYTKLALFDEAVQSFKKARMWQDAAKVYTQIKKFDKAGEMFLKAHNEKDAAFAFEEAKLYAKAAPLFVKINRVDKAIANYKKAKDWSSTAALLVKERKYKDAILYYNKAEDWEKVGDLYSQLNKWSKAVSFYRRAKKVLKAAQATLHVGASVQVARDFEESGFYRCAAAVYLAAKKPAKAYITYLKADQGKDSDYSLLVEAGRVAELSRKKKKMREAFHDALRIEKKHHMFRKMLGTYRSISQERQGLRFVRSRAKDFIKMKEYWLAYKASEDVKRTIELSLIQKISFNKIQSQVLPFIKFAPQIINMKQDFVKAEGDEGKHPHTNISVSLHTPIGAKVTEAYVVCRLFQKDLGGYGGVTQDDISLVDVCRDYKGTRAQMEAFETAPSVVVFTRKIEGLKADSKRIVNFQHKSNIPYKILSCHLQQKKELVFEEPAKKPKKRKKKRKKRRRRRR
ncbi:MAG: hypothetical protein CL920_09505 [Deltaproteobacteria bacterium]|nr:hypothetical protein [Deltaproteobacteria bacterium]MBU48921.1 hypothetical protein [Deltaproteobacteria bacterium]